MLLQRIIVVSEYWRSNLKKVDRSLFTEEYLMAISKQILLGLAHLNQVDFSGYIN